MRTLTDKKTKELVLVPTGFSEITLRHWAEITAAGEDQTKLVAAIIQRPVEFVSRLSQESMVKIVELCKYFGKMDPDTWVMPALLKIKYGHRVADGTVPKLVDVVKTISPVMDIREKSFGQKILIERILKDSGNVINNLPTILEVYLQPLLTGQDYDVEKSEQVQKVIYNQVSLPDAYTIGASITKQLLAIKKREAEQLNKPPTSDQISAGINMFNEFGVVNTIDALAGGDVLKYDAVLKKDYNTIFLKLKKSKVQQIFEENYTEVLKRKQPQAK